MTELTHSPKAVHAKEDLLHKHPLAFRFALSLFVLLGALIFGGIMIVSLLLLAGAIALVLSGKGAVLLVKVLKVAWVLFIPLWGLVRVGWRALTSRQPMPQGRRLRREEAPALFADLDAMRQKMRGPKINGVLLQAEMNAFAISRPLGGFWFVPWKQRFIGLGVPLIQTLSEQEAMAVVAHEYGHLSGHPSRFDSFIYQIRSRLIELWQHASAWEDWPSRMLRRLLNWYIPLFDQWAFALCRAAEYAADRASSALVGAQPAAEALMRFRVADAYIARHFWNDIYARARSEADPLAVKPWQQLPVIVRTRHDSDLSSDLLRDALQVETNTYDTHPALSDRLQALSFDTAPYRQRGCAVEPAAEQTAAEAWFGGQLPAILAEFEKEWGSNVEEWWKKTYDEEQQRQASRRELETRAGPLSDDETWELLTLRISAGEITDPDTEVRAFIEAHPQHMPSLLAWGANNLDSEPAAALEAIQRAMRHGRQFALDGAKILAHYYARRDEYRHAIYSQMAEHFENKNPWEGRR